nr:immunoglobulin heavy chain junction region [Mus musculus]NSM08866.1 immunoglobulin heavy chain junction region [Mus musculus]
CARGIYYEGYFDVW